MATLRVPWRTMPDGNDGADVVLPTELAHHLVHVLRLREGGEFVAFDPGRGVERDGVLVAIAREGGEGARRSAFAARLGPPRAGAVRAGAVILVQGLAKGEKCDAIVRDATELGAARIVFAATERAVVRLEGVRADERRARWRRIAEEAARQSGRADAPQIDGPLPWAEALSAAVGSTGGAAVGVCLYEQAVEPAFPHVARAVAADTAVAFAVGPEGGLSDEEVNVARVAGWAIASLGPFTLRTETVAAAVLGTRLLLSGA